MLICGNMSLQDSSNQVRVHCLKTVEENAILDIDDLVMDVCSDKDMVGMFVLIDSFLILFFSFSSLYFLFILQSKQKVAVIISRSLICNR